MDLPARTLSPDDALSKLLPASVAVPLAGLEILTVEDLYDMIASLGAGWFREVQGLDAQGAAAIVSWLADFGRGVGEVTERFYPAGFAPETKHANEPDYGIVPLERLTLTSVELGEGAINRAPAVGCSLEARDDLEALKQWLVARAPNPNTRGNYRKEAERYLLWCVRERGTALSAVARVPRPHGRSRLGADLEDPAERLDRPQEHAQKESALAPLQRTAFRHEPPKRRDGRAAALQLS